MRKVLSSLPLLFSLALSAQTVDAYFQKIRNHAAALTAFFSAMPKGGDLHHHFSGSVYGETFLQTALEKNFLVNTRTLQIAEGRPDGDTAWVSLQSFKDDAFEALKEKLLQRWSVKDYDGTVPPAERFFHSFGQFGPAVRQSVAKGLTELKARAKAENVSYIETSVWSTACNVAVPDNGRVAARLRSLADARNATALLPLLDTLWTAIRDSSRTCVVNYKNLLTGLHGGLHLDDSSFVIRFQTAVNRNRPPLPFFIDLVGAFEAANGDPLIVGVNILAPEHYETAMRDYWLHMQMFGFLRSKYASVKCSLHAGELTLGLVRPEDLTWHINEAVHTAKAARIGHGVDLPYERNAAALLAQMKKDTVAVEINLSSNEFILGVKDDRHPILLYKAAGVPIVICTDDAGVLRTNLTEQYVLLAKRYPSVSYADIKGFVFNSIARSFLPPAAVKEQLQKLKAAFRSFEANLLSPQTK